MDDLSQRRLAGEGPKGVARINGRVVIMVDTNLPLTVNQSGVIINKHLGLSGYECLPKAMPTQGNDAQPLGTIYIRNPLYSL